MIILYTNGSNAQNVMWKKISKYKYSHILQLINEKYAHFSQATQQFSCGYVENEKMRGIVLAGGYRYIRYSNYCRKETYFFNLETGLWKQLGNLNYDRGYSNQNLLVMKVSWLYGKFYLLHNGPANPWNICYNFLKNLNIQVRMYSIIYINNNISKISNNRTRFTWWEAIDNIFLPIGDIVLHTWIVLK